MSPHSQYFQQAAVLNRSHPLCNLVYLTKIKFSNTCYFKDLMCRFLLSGLLQKTYLTPRKVQTGFQATHKIFKASKATIKLNYRMQTQLTWVTESCQRFSTGLRC